MQYYITTFGCQANERDSETIAGILEEMGYRRAASAEDSDIIIFNTCCIRDKAENKVLSQVGELKELKAKRPDLIIGICGCMVQQEKMPAYLARKAPHVDLLFGTHNIHELPELIAGVLRHRSPQVKVVTDSDEIREDLPVKRRFSFKALVNITYGCNNFCSYCVVPYVRGREKSREPQEILREITGLAASGVLEVTLLGQNVNSYGKDLQPPVNFAFLLEKVNKIPGLKRIRYMTSHPRDFNLDLLDTIKETEKVCRHFHLPVQSGSSAILAKMNRGYTREAYLKLVAGIRERFPDASLTTDIIVGFPGESEEDFLETLTLVEKVRFDSAFTFSYSPRKGTPAALMENQIKTAVKKQRLQRLMDLQNKISLEKNMALQDKIVEVLVDGPSKTKANILTGRTETNKTVLFPFASDLTGRFVKVRITRPQTWVLKGEYLI